MGWDDFVDYVNPNARIARAKRLESDWMGAPPPVELAETVAKNLGLAPGSIKTNRDLAIATEHYKAFAPRSKSELDRKLELVGGVESLSPEERKKMAGAYIETKTPEIPADIRKIEEYEKKYGPLTPAQRERMVGIAPPQGPQPQKETIYDTFLKGQEQLGITDPNVIADNWGKYQAKLTGMKADETLGVSFGDLPEEEKTAWYELYEATKERPPFAFRDTKGRTAFSQGFAQYMNKKGQTGRGVAAERGEVKALSSSLQNQQKIRGMMGSFARNIDMQVDRLDEQMEKMISRVGFRAIDMPLREIKTRIIGSADEAIVNGYLTEISNEIGKLSTGSSASIAELSVGAQEKWAKIHDPNLSIKEIKQILKETKHMASMRLDSADKEIEKTMGKLQGNYTEPKAEKKIVEKRKTKGGKILVKYDDGTIEELK